SRLAQPLLPAPPTRSYTSFDAHVRATLQRLNRYAINNVEQTLSNSDSDSDSGSDSGSDEEGQGASKKPPYRNRFIYGSSVHQNRKDEKDRRLSTNKTPRTEGSAHVDVHSELSGSDVDFNTTIYDLRKESCERLASAWQDIFDRFGPAPGEEDSGVDSSEIAELIRSRARKKTDSGSRGRSRSRSRSRNRTIKYEQHQREEDQDEDEDEPEEEEEEGNARSVSEDEDQSPSRYPNHVHKRDRHHHHRRHRQVQEEQDLSDSSRYIPKDRHHSGHSNRVHSSSDSSNTVHRRKEEYRVPGSDDSQEESETRHSYSDGAAHSLVEEEEATAEGSQIEMDDPQTGSDYQEDTTDTFNHAWDRLHPKQVQELWDDDLSIMRRAFNKWRALSALRYDYSDSEWMRHDTQDEEQEEREEEGYDGDQSDTEVEQEPQSIRLRREQQQDEGDEEEEEKYLSSASPKLQQTTKGPWDLTSGSAALYNRSSSMRLHMKPQTRALADLLSPRKAALPTPLRLLNTASGLNPFAAGDGGGSANWRLSEIYETRPSPPPFSPSPSPTRNMWPSDALPDFSATASPTTTPQKQRRQYGPSYYMTTPTASTKVIDDLYRLRDEVESDACSTPSGTPQRCRILNIPTTPTSSRIDTLYRPETESEFATFTLPPLPVEPTILNEVDEELLRATAALSTRTPRKSRVVLDPEEARLMTPRSKALANLLMSKKKVPLSSALPASSPAPLTSVSGSGSGSVSGSRSVSTVTPSISSSTSTPTPSISSPPPPLPSRLLLLPPRFQLHSGYPMEEGRGSKRQYGQDDDGAGGGGDDMDEFMGQSFKLVKTGNHDGIFHSQRSSSPSPFS
ncbi:hypothetical protein BGZ97_006217, partial [Linnemannia gamsii]